MILLLLFCLLRRQPLEPHVFYVYVFCIHFYFQQPNTTPYRLALTFYLFSTITIHCRSNDLLNRHYSRLSFFSVIYFPNNTGERCVFNINFHIGKCDALNILLLLFCLYCCLLPVPHVIDC